METNINVADSASVHDSSLSLKKTAKALAELQQIKARTMYNMVEDVEMSSGHKKVLYLTNHQCSVFTTGLHVDRIFDAMELPHPRLVINLTQSMSGTPWMEDKQDKNPTVRREHNWESDCPDGCTYYGPGISKAAEVQEGERQLELFFKDHLIPLAAESSAIILLGPLTDCTSAMVFSQALREVRLRYGPQLPFSVVSLGAAFDVSMRALLYNGLSSEGNYEYELAQGLEKFRERLTLFNQTILSTSSFVREFANSKLNPEIDSLILVESIDERAQPPRVDYSEKTRLENLVLHHLTSTLPSLVLATHRSSAAQPIDKCVSFTSMGIPVLFLDLRPRPVPEAAEEDRAKTMEALLAMWRADCKACYEDCGSECYDFCSLAYFYDLLYGDGNPNQTSVQKNLSERHGVQREWLCDAIRRRRRNEMTGSEQPFPAEKHITRAASELLDKDCEDIFTYAPKELKDEVGNYAALREHRRYRQQLRDRFRGYYALLSSDNFFGANICDPQGISALIARLTKLDRLPQENSLQALLLLREAWDTVDLCNLTSSRNKVLAKASFGLLLLLTIATTTCTVLTPEIDTGDEALQRTRSEITLFFLALAASVVGAAVSFWNPAQRWRQVRGAGLSLEAAIWQFRTRTGRYAIKSGARGADRELEKTISAARASVLAEGNVAQTAFLRKRSGDEFVHGQHAAPQAGSARAGAAVAPLDEEAGHIWDDHFSPINPAAYIELRIRKMIAFYESRLPGYSRSYQFCQLTLILSSAVGAAMAFLGLSRYVAVIAAGGAALTAWQEFHNTDKKLMRYNESITALKSLLTWWYSLNDIERAALDTITQLVQTAEQIITGELLAWLSTPGEKEKDKGRAAGSDSDAGEDADKSKTSGSQKGKAD